MFIVIEGVDKCGKSTLARKLSLELDIPIVKFSQPKGDPFLEYVNFLLTRKEPAILDRFYLGEEVYGPLKRGGSQLADWQRRTLEELLAIRGALCIYVTTDARTIARKFKEEKETFVMTDEIETLLHGYSTAVKASELDWVLHDYQKPATLRNIGNRVAEWSRDMLEHGQLIRDLIPLRTKGNLQTATLFVGDIVNVEAEPFGGPYRGLMVPFLRGHATTGLYDALHASGYSLANYAITNARKVHMTPEDGDGLYHELRLPNLKHVVMLGNHAKEAIATLKAQLVGDEEAELLFKRLKFIEAPHPSYARRFNKMDDLIKVIPKRG